MVKHTKDSIIGIILNLSSWLIFYVMEINDINLKISIPTAIGTFILVAGIYNLISYSHKKIVESGNNENSFSIVVCILSCMILLVGILLVCRNISGILFKMDTMDEISYIHVGSFFCVISGIVGLRNRMAYFKLNMIPSLFFVTFGVLILLKCNLK